MKRLAPLIAIIALLAACADLPPEKPLRADEDYYSKAMYFFDRGNYFDAIPAFEELREKFPLSPYAVLAELRLGDSHFRKADHIEATHYFENFRRLHPSNPNVPYSIYMTGMCHYMQILSLDRDQTAAREALEHFTMLIDLFPASPFAGKALCKLSDAKQRIAEHEFFVGEFYLKKGNPMGAIERFNKVLKQYPHSIPKDKVLFYLAKATAASGNRLRGERILSLLLKKYPESLYAEEARSLLAGQAVLPSDNETI